VLTLLASAEDTHSARPKPLGVTVDPLRVTVAVYYAAVDGFWLFCSICCI